LKAVKAVEVDIVRCPGKVGRREATHRLRLQAMRRRVCGLSEGRRTRDAGGLREDKRERERFLTVPSETARTLRTTNELGRKLGRKTGEEGMTKGGRKVDLVLVEGKTAVKEDFKAV
jgi:hypothetical protein